MVLSLHGQDDLADIFPFLNVGVCRGGFRQRKRFTDHRLDLARCVHAENLVEFGAQQRGARSQTKKTHPDYGDVAAQQLQRMKPGSLSNRPGSAHEASFSVWSRSRGEAVNHEPPGDTEALIASREAFSADRIHHHFDSVRSEFAHHLDKIVFLIINRVIHSDLAEVLLLRRARGAEDHKSTRLCKLHCGDPHTTRRAMNENSVPWLQIAHREHRVIRGQIIPRDSGSIVKRHACWQAIDLPCWNSNPARVSIELRKSSNCFAGSKRLTLRRFAAALGNFLNHPGNLQARNERRFGRSGINPHALQKVGKIYANRFSPGERFSPLWLGIGDLTSLKNFRCSILPNDHGAHLSLLVPLLSFPRRVSYPTGFRFGFEASYLKL